MKVLLINPPFNSFSDTQPPEVLFPLGLGYLASAIRENSNAEVEILDCVVEDFVARPYKGTKTFNFGLTNAKLKERIEKIAPNIVGITCAFTKRWQNVLDVAKVVKEIDSKIRVIVGGAHPSAFPSQCLGDYVDTVVVGEGERAIISAISNGGSEFLHYSFIDDLDDIAFPARDMVDMAPYLKGKRDNFITSRGCPYSCTYCSIHCVWGRRWRGRSAKSVVNEVEECVKEYNLDVVSFMDDNITLQRDRMIEICEEMMKRNLNVYWNIPNGTSVAHLDAELISMMKTSGCYALNLAIESGNEDILHNSMNKQITLEKGREIARLCKDIGVLTLGYFILGMPGETLETMKDTMRFAKELELDCVNVLIATPYPGTQLYDICEENKWLKTTNLDQYTAFDAVIETPLLKADDVEQYAKDFRWEYEEWYNKRHSPPTQIIKDAIRRPERGLVESCLERRFRS